MPGFDLLLANFLSPVVLAFALGVIAGLIRSELELPEAILKLLAIYLLFSIGLKGGSELAKVEFSAISGLLLATIALTIAIPVLCFYVLRTVGRLDVANAAAVAAHYGSVSSVTFFTAMTLASSLGTPSEGYMTGVVAVMEWGVIVALMLARWHLGQERGGTRIGELVLDTLRGRGIILLTGGMAIGMLTGDSGWSQISPFYDELFRGMLMLFLLEMGMTAARQIRSFAQVGVVMTTFAVVAPLLLGLLGTWVGHVFGLSTGGAFVLGAVCASASYIDAPAACRAALPQANPGIYLTASLGVTFPFNLLVGLPIYYQFARWLGGA